MKQLQFKGLSAKQLQMLCTLSQHSPELARAVFAETVDPHARCEIAWQPWHRSKDKPKVPKLTKEQRALQRKQAKALAVGRPFQP